MKNLVLVRIDDRLIHGQIATQWLKSTHGNKILIIDDEVINNQLQVRILKAAAPPNIKVVIKTVEEGISYCKKEQKENEKIVLIVRYPQPIESLIDSGIPISKVILGGMGMKSGRSQINRNVSASKEEVECLKRIISKGTKIYYQLVPSETAKDLKNILEGEF